VEGRQILDGILSVNEIINSLKSSRYPGMLLKLSLSKAFNKLSWTFLERMLLAFGFASHWISWIKNLTSSAFFSILVNGMPSQPFKSSRGIRQGGPLSPFLFTLMMEGLGRMLSAATVNNDIRGIQLHPGDEAHSHQQFVDDTMLMGYASVQEAHSLRSGLDMFLEASGLEINEDKSQVFFFNSPQVNRRNILQRVWIILKLLT